LIFISTVVIWALAPEVTVQGHADRCIGQSGRNASVSDGEAIGQLTAQGALDGDAIAMDAGEFYSEQRGKWNLGQEVTNLLGGEFRVCHGEESSF
jgi:hypothetical protein